MRPRHNGVQIKAPVSSPGQVDPDQSQRRLDTLPFRQPGTSIANGNMGQLNRSRNLLLVEDDVSLRLALTFAFEADGYRVQPYADAWEVLEAPTDALLADCMIVDYRLPRMDGLALLAALRQRRITSPAILITSHPDERCRRRALAAEVEIVEKPLVSDELRRRVKQITG